MEDEAWTKALSCELSRQLSSSPSSSGEKSFLYKALGTVLGACKEVLYVQEKLLQHLEGANAEEPSEAQVSFPSRFCEHPRFVPGAEGFSWPCSRPFNLLPAAASLK
ncbi:maestro heat-like repeat-containing protein family member 1 [Meleagris gallopavo]|uniref:maestro heat-like repeat-containing protein family member 1 n=1 Tax=Meleagris gallopavo TaxID=9103 RepID=UPI00093F9A0F|nr:maestro heat-like repeat-containing protein family member 1 [Meleagris gallopavo]